jgi:glutathionylspermidine synthase
MSKCATMPETAAAPWCCGRSLPPADAERVLRQAMFECCKWHTHIEDQPVLCPFPLVVEQPTWDWLQRQAEALARETLAAEQEIARRTDLHAELGLPWALRRRLRRATANDSAPRVIRFDFHWTTDGWRISEANSDVAAGYIEASGVTALVAAHHPGLLPAGDPAGALAAMIAGRLGARGTVGLMHLTVHVDDRQIALYLARRFAEHGLVPILFDPTQLTWRGNRAWAVGAEHAGPLDLVFRFFPAEWLPRLPWRTRWHRLIEDRPTLVCNPVAAVLSQSKRFPLVWDRLATPLPTWRALLPETRSPRRVMPIEEDGWVLKPALGHEGHHIGIRGVTDAPEWECIRQWAHRSAGGWAAQRRFTPVALPTPEGVRYPCLGVYVIDGHAAGAYGRIANRPLIDERSREVVVLIAPPGEGDA